MPFATVKQFAHNSYAGKIGITVACDRDAMISAEQIALLVDGECAPIQLVRSTYTPDIRRSLCVWL